MFPLFYIDRGRAKFPLTPSVTECPIYDDRELSRARAMDMRHTLSLYGPSSLSFDGARMRTLNSAPSRATKIAHQCPGDNHDSLIGRERLREG